MEFLGLVIVLFVIALLILPWVNLVRLNSQKKELDELKAELARLSLEGTRMERDEVAQEKLEGESVEPVEVSPPAMPNSELPFESRVEAKLSAAEKVSAPKVVPKAPITHVSGQPSHEPEEAHDPQDWFGKLVVWIGGIALLMAGFYMVKYSIDSGWLTPSVFVG